eukprot:gene16205-21456_t
MAAADGAPLAAPVGIGRPLQLKKKAGKHGQTKRGWGLPLPFPN